MDLYNIDHINGIYFTRREIDIIACVINLRGIKKIASILSISPTTAQGYIQNILLKISANSKENIQDFVEKSDKIIVLRRRYYDLLINSFFIQQIKKLPLLTKNYKTSCVIVHYYKNNLLDYIIKCLKLANIATIFKTDDILLESSKEKPITILSVLNQEFLTKSILDKNTIFLYIEPNLRNFVLELSKSFQVIDCTQKDQIYYEIFRLLQLLIPNLDFTNLIKEFTFLYNNLKVAEINIIQSNNEVDQLDTTSVKSLQSIPKSLLPHKINKNIIIFMIIIVVITIIVINLGLGLLKINKDNFSIIRNATKVSSNFAIPDQSILLKREALIKQINQCYNTKEDIKTVVLVGIGGSGKTTAARKYAQLHDAKVTWEINAETHSSLTGSMAQFAYALSKTMEDKRELNKILEIKNLEHKVQHVLLFIQSKLKTAQNWLLIYDNVKAFKDIQKYFPNNIGAWGKGEVIITTRNMNIKNNNYISASNMLDVGKLTSEEKYQLFTRIIGKEAALTQKDYITQTREFLQQLPSFPLDISLAAYYIKETGVRYDKYLEYITQPSKIFTSLQKDVLQNANEYSETRYNIVALWAKLIVETGVEYRDLLLLLSLIDSQNIPQELLFTYKDHITVSNFINELKKNSFLLTAQRLSTSADQKDGLRTFSIHRSTQQIALVYLTELLDLKQNQKLLRFIANIVENYVSNLVDIEDSFQLRFFLTHCESFLVRGEGILDKKSKSIIQNSLGVIYYYLGHDTEAQQMLEDSIRTLDEESVAKAWALLHLGAVYRKIGKDYVYAIKLLRQSISIYQKHSNMEVGAAMALTHLGNVYRTLGDFKKAREALEQSIEIYKKHPKHRAGTARALAYLGVVYREQSNYEKAQEFLEQSIEIYNIYHLDKHNSVFAAALAHLGIVHRMREHFEEARVLLQQSLEIYKEIRPENHPDIGRNILNLGIIYGELGDLPNAKRLLHQSLITYDENYGKQHIETGKVLNHLARVYILDNKLDTAESIVMRAEDILKNNKHPEFYRSLELLGDIYLQRSYDAIKSKKMEDQKVVQNKAINYFGKALEVGRRYFSADSPHIVRLKSKTQKTTN